MGIKERVCKLLKIVVGIAGSIVTIFGIIQGIDYLKGKNHEKSPDVLISEEMHSLYSCKVQGIDDTCILFTTDDRSYMPYLSLDTSNSSDHPITLKNEDAVTVEVEDFIPYADIGVYDEVGGADGWSTIDNFIANIGTAKGNYTAYEEDYSDNLSPDYYSSKEIDPDEAARLCLYIYPQEAGLYKIKVHFKYYYKNEDYSYDSEEYYYVCQDGVYY